MKKEGDSFRVIIGAYDRAEVYELIGIYMLYLIGKKYSSKNIGLYRDNGPSVFKNARRPASEKIKKQLQYFYKQKGLQIIVLYMLKTVLVFIYK